MGASLAAQDITPPDTPLLDSVSVYDNVTGSAIIAWHPCDSADVVGYILFKNVNTVWNIVDTILAPATSYIDVTAQAQYHPELYRMAAYDESGNLSPMTLANQYHNTMYVFPYEETDNCQPLIRLHWNRYLNWSEGVKQYQVWYSENFGTFQLLTVNQGDVSGYRHFGISDATSYCYFIRAISNTGKTSTSNVTCIYIDYPNIPTFAMIDYVTVNPSGQIEISSTLDNTAQVNNYRLERAPAFTDAYSTVATITGYQGNTWVYTDAASVTTQWFYRLIATDACGNSLYTSEIASNIVTYGSANRELTHRVWWNRYRWFPGDVESYDVFRSADDKPFEHIGNTSDTVWLDVVESFAGGEYTGKFDYYVMANESTVAPGNGNKSRSSGVCLYEFSRVFIPNTFSPNEDSLNAVFKPSVSFVLKDGYHFSVYSRWGDQIFHTTNPLEGWNGKYNGKPMKADSYVYLLRYGNQMGESFEKSGFVHIYYPPKN
ncbi:MAG: hypothetical protein CVU05_13175 [Bacteroidetes bacterium HGW-Bacteroidetes-21]|nr:MAG: hypothetical protein CVU05_13175 [Bacteroidetes bacterium HGW-Bacteroidetes-21]